MANRWNTTEASGKRVCRKCGRTRPAAWFRGERGLTCKGCERERNRKDSRNYALRRPDYHRNYKSVQAAVKAARGLHTPLPHGISEPDFWEEHRFTKQEWARVYDDEPTMEAWAELADRYAPVRLPCGGINAGAAGDARPASHLLSVQAVYGIYASTTEDN